MASSRDLRVMLGEVFTIQLKDGARPFCVNTPRRVSFAYREPLKEQLDTLTAQGIITPVTAPSRWCTPIVVVPRKSSDEVRLCVDGACAHYVMVSKFQWKPSWLATQRDPQNDWTATQNRVNYDVFAQAPFHAVE